MDIFSKQNAAAKLRHASPERQTTAEEPLQDHDTEGSVSPLPTSEPDDRPQEALQAYDPQVGPSRLGVRRRQTPHSLSPPRRPASDSSEEAPLAYRSHEVPFVFQLEASKPELMDSFKAYDDEKNTLIQGYHDQYVDLKKAEAKRLGEIYVPEDESPDFLEHLAATMPKRPKQKENVIKRKRVPRDSSESEDAETLQPEIYHPTHHQEQDGYMGREPLGNVERLAQQLRSSVLERNSPPMVSHRYVAPPLNRNLSAFPGSQHRGAAQMTDQQLRSNVLESDLSFSPDGDERFATNQPATRQDQSGERSISSDYYTDGSPSLREFSITSPDPGDRQPGRPSGRGRPDPSYGPAGLHFPHSNNRVVPFTLVELDIMVKLTLIPIFTILKTREDAHNPDVVDQLSTAARKATSLIRRSDHYSSPAGTIIHGRCCFYVGFTRILKAKVDGFNHRPHRWLRRAMADATGLPEATMAKEMLEALTPVVSPDMTRSPVSSVQSPTAAEAERPATADSAVSASVNVRPSTAGSWVNGLWGKVAQAVGRSGNGANLAPAPFEILDTRDPLPENPALDSIIPMEYTADRVIPITTGQHRVPLTRGQHTGGTMILDHYGVEYTEKRPFFSDAELVTSPEYLPGHFDQPNPNLPTGGLVDISNMYRLRRGRVRDASYSDPATRGVPVGLLERSEASIGTLNTVQEEPNDTAQEPSPAVSQIRGYRVMNPDPSSSSENSAPPVTQRYRIVNPDPSSSADSVPPEGAILPLHNTRPPPRRTISYEYYEPGDQSASIPVSASRSPRKSVVFAMLENLPSPTRFTNSEPRERQPSLSASAVSAGLSVRRRLSLAVTGGIQAITTGREAADPLATAEEGNSPFLKTTFGAGGGGTTAKSWSTGDEGEDKLPKPPKSPDEMV